MCGITGFLDQSSLSKDDRLGVILRMMEPITHRGPDDAGEFIDLQSGLCFGFRRLSILDLSSAGHQPMTSRGGRFTLIFNGEIYNFRELRQELEDAGHVFAGGSDTEVMLAAFMEWGCPSAVNRFAGMFAMAVWDKQSQSLHLVRDRTGKKPLYYGWQNGSFLFGSELKSLRAHPSFAAAISMEAVANYLRFSYVPGPATIYSGIFKLEPGSVLTIALNKGEITQHKETYWDLRKVAMEGQISQLTSSPEEAMEELESLLKTAVKERMIADVPLGAFLSGGIDSSLIVALMQAQASRPVKTFTIGFENAAYNEADNAKSVALHLGTEHTEFYITAQEARDVIPALPSIYDEPFSDSSQIPTFLVSKLARKHVTVVLSGDGADEYFAGYNRYVVGARSWAAIKPLPLSMRQGIAYLLTTTSPASWDERIAFMEKLIPQSRRRTVSGDRLHKIAGPLQANSLQDVYKYFVSTWENPAELMKHPVDENNILTQSARWTDSENPINQMMLLDQLSYLPDDILVKVDRATMAVSLEARAPYLDHRVAEFSWRLPLAYKIKKGKGKWILREILRKYVPEKLTNRPKMGFGLPIGDWLRGPLRPWAEDLLSVEGLVQDGILNPAPVRQKWKEHLSGTRNWHYQLWNILVLRQWLESEKSVSFSKCQRPMQNRMFETTL